MVLVTTTKGAGKAIVNSGASSSSAGKRGREAALHLYRSILKAHKNHLPTEMKQLGNAYVRSEFKLHKTVTKPEHLEPFYKEWEKYLEMLMTTARAKESFASAGVNVEQTTSTTQTTQQQQQQEPALGFSYGKDLPSDMKLPEEQVEQLEKLKESVLKRK